MHERTAAVPGTGRARRVGPLLVLEAGTILPPLCVKCGADGPLETRSHVFRYVPGWARFFGVVVRLVVQKKSRFDLPICPRCNAAWKRWNAIASLGFLAPIGMIAVSSVVLASGATPGATSSRFLAAMLASVVGSIAVLRLRERRVVTATRIDVEETWLAGVHEASLRAATERRR